MLIHTVFNIYMSILVTDFQQRYNETPMRYHTQTRINKKKRVFSQARSN